MYQPIKDRVAIVPKFESNKYATSDKNVTIIRPDSVKRRTTQGIVKYIGPEVSENISIGDYVFYGAYDGTLFYDKEELLIILPEEFIKAKLVNIPDTTVRNLFILGKLDIEQNRMRLLQLANEYVEWKISQNDDIITIGSFAQYLQDKVDAYGRHFEAPLDKAIELIVETVKESDWSRGIEVSGGEIVFDPTLYDENKRTCEYCGGTMHLLRDRSTTTVFYKCKECGKVRDRRTIKDVTIQHD